MRALITLLSKELKHLVHSPIAIVVLVVFLTINNLLFVVVFDFYASPLPPDRPPLTLIFGGTFFFWLNLLVLIPAITMRLFAEERRSGTLETLMTAPVTEFQIVSAKYLAGLFFFAFLWVPTLLYVGIVEAYGTLDYGPVLSSYIGVLLLGAAFVAVGCFTSALARSQIVAFSGAFLCLALLFSIGFLGDVVESERLRAVVRYMSIQEHFGDFPSGILDRQHVVYFGSIAVLFFFWTVQTMERRRWG